MRVELPKFTRCCVCVPLRQGIITLGFLKLALDWLVIGIRLYKAIILHHEVDSTCIIVVTFFLTDAVFSLLLIVAGYKKYPKMLRVSIIYNIAWLMLVLVLGGILIYLDIGRVYRMWDENPYTVLDLLALISVVFAITFVQVYVILLTRSEEIKLRNQTLEMQFINNATDGESRCECTDDERDTSTPLTINNGRHIRVPDADKGHEITV